MPAGTREQSVCEDDINRRWRSELTSNRVRRFGVASWVEDVKNASVQVGVICAFQILFRPRRMVMRISKCWDNESSLQIDFFRWAMWLLSRQNAVHAVKRRGLPQGSHQNRPSGVTSKPA